MENCRVSVVMCTYNGERYINEQLDSINRQSILPFELIVCDDCSSDSTLSIVEKFKKIAKFDITIHKNEINFGVTKNFEQACNIASGDIIFFADQDDLWREDKIAKHLEIYNKFQNIKLVFSDAILFGDDENFSDKLWDRFCFNGKKKKMFYKNQLQAILIGWFVTGTTMSARKEFINSSIPFNKTLLHDEWLSFLASKNNNMFALNECLTSYRQHHHQVIGASAYSLKEKVDKKWDFTAQINKLSALLECDTDNKFIKDSIVMLKNRCTLKDKNIINRFFLATKMLYRGQYARYCQNAILSYVKDIIMR